MRETCQSGLDMGFTALSYGKVAFLGVVQGVTELLPISSTAHMRLVPALLGWPDPGSAFSAAMQLAALTAVLAYFWSDVRGLVSNAAAAIAGRPSNPHDLRLTIAIGLATVPLVVAGIALAPLLNACHSPLRSLSVVGWSCVAMAALLAAAEVFAAHRRTLQDSSLADAIAVGIAQVGALLPGVSRSGSTLTAALALGFRREEAARLSFLLGIPAIGLAGARELWALWGAHLDAHGWSVLAVGLIVASISAFAGIWGLMRLLERFSAWPFVIYRALLGAIILVLAWRGAIV